MLPIKLRKKSSKPTLHIYFDTETYVVNPNDIDNVEIKPYLVGWYACENFNDEPKKIEYCVNGAEKFIDFLKSKNDAYTLIIYAYNIKYDLLTLIARYFPKLPEVNNETEEKQYHLKFQTGTGRNKTFVMFKYKNKGVLTVTGVDLLSWIKHRSLKCWTDALKIKTKGKLEHYEKYDAICDETNIHFIDGNGYKTKVSLKTELEYLHIDVISLWHIHRHIKTVQADVLKALKMKIYTGFKGNTCGSYAKYLANQFLELKFDELFRPITSDSFLSEKCMNSSNGGYTSRSIKYSKVEGNIVSYDVNSMYPDVMTKSLPYGLPIFCSKDLNKNMEYVMWYEIVFTKIEWKEKYKDLQDPPYSVNRIGTLCFIWQEYYEFLKKYTNNDIVILDCFWQESAPLLNPLVKKLYKERLLAKEIHVKEGIKLFMNNFYGKTCEKPHVEKRLYLDNNFKTTPISAEKMIHRVTLTGVYVVNYARLRLLQSIVDEIDNGNEFLYCDTDSIKMIENNTPLFKVSGIVKELGDWKKEGVYTHYFNNGVKKKYLLWDENGIEPMKLALSGITREAKDLLEKQPIELLIDIFDPKNNYVFINGCRKASTTPLYNQTIISTTDSQFNATIQPTHYIICKDGVVKYGKWAEYDKEKT